MSQRQQTRSLVGTAVGLTLAISLFGVTDAIASDYAITQAGWLGAGTVTGHFSGEDVNHDGYIDLASGEVSSYQITFSGNSFIPDFTHGLSELRFFRYTVGTSGFRPSFPLYSTDGSYFYDADDHVIGRPDLSVSTFTTQDAAVATVPEPSSMLLFGIGLAGLFFARRRRHFSSAFHERSGR